MMFYFIFGIGYMGYLGYVWVMVLDVDKVWDIMVRYYGLKWCGQYFSLYFIDNVDCQLQDMLVWLEQRK